MNTASLSDFLQARFDEDERIAASRESWTAFDESQGMRRVDVDHSIERVVACTRSWRGEHIACHDPARVLREIDAKRQIAELHSIVHRNIGWLEDGDEDNGEIPVCGSCVPKHSWFGCRADVPEGPCLTARLLALPYDAHPDYREQWRP